MSGVGCNTTWWRRDEDFDLWQTVGSFPPTLFDEHPAPMLGQDQHLFDGS
jgi:hypothetical protein